MLLYRPFAVFAAPLLALVLSPRPDTLSWIMLGLVTFIGAIIHRYSDRYLDGQEAKSRYAGWFLGTIAAVSMLVLAGDLRVLALAWTFSSLFLHQLLSFFSDRRPSQLAAHKKFLLSRVADVVIYAGVFSIGGALGTYEIGAFGARLAALGAAPTGVEVGAFLLAGGVILRSAQLPFHGWLIQVMEAPTPVSALLHAGVVNMGGFVMIRLADLMGPLAGPQTLLVVFGAVTAVLAALVMSTCASIKVSLAWSTVAQMGFMLLECGLGAYGLALVHLVAHSLYKAHAFLSSGSVVGAYSHRMLSPRVRSYGVVAQLAVAALAIVVVFGAGSLTFGDPLADPRLWVPGLIFALALVPLMLTSGKGKGAVQPALYGAVALGLTLIFLVLHGAGDTIVPPLADAIPDPFRAGFAASLLVALFLVQLVVSAFPDGRLSARLYPWFAGGFHLDELFTRLTFLVWPPRYARRAQGAVRASVEAPARRAA